MLHSLIVLYQHTIHIQLYSVDQSVVGLWCPLHDGGWKELPERQAWEVEDAHRRGKAVQFDISLTPRVESVWLSSP